METKSCTLTTQEIIEYSQNHHQCTYEHEMLEEIRLLCEKQDTLLLDWFAQFGENIRTIVFNVHAYRMGLRFGFSEIAFDEYGWFKKPAFLDLEELKFGLTDSDRFGNYSTITLGRGSYQVWTFGMSLSYGTAGSSSGICVYGKCFSSREEALDEALQQLKNSMLSKVGDTDTTNFNQKVISATLKSIENLAVGKSQLSLF